MQCWNKLRMWEMCEYSRLVYLDADMIVRKNIDHLFGLPGQGAFYAVGDCYGGRETAEERDGCCFHDPASVPQYFNAGMYVMTPSLQVLEGMKAQLATGENFVNFFAEQVGWQRWPYLSWWSARPALDPDDQLCPGATMESHRISPCAAGLPERLLEGALDAAALHLQRPEAHQVPPPWPLGLGGGASRAHRGRKALGQQVSRIMMMLESLSQGLQLHQAYRQLYACHGACRYSEENLHYSEIMDYWWAVFQGTAPPLPAPPSSPHDANSDEEGGGARRRAPTPPGPAR